MPKPHSPGVWVSLFSLSPLICGREWGGSLKESGTSPWGWLLNPTAGSVPSTLETSMLRRAALLHLLGCSRGLSG